jgi:hypothetical protein
MTGTEVDLDTQAQRLAAQGREALVERLRTAYSDAAAAHADLISLDDARIEAMVQSAADRADGLQWRRALAAVAADQFGVSPADALEHPAVVRAQSLVGAPSYEQSLAELISRPVPLPEPALADHAPAQPAPADHAPAPADHAPAQPAEAGDETGAELAEAGVPEPEPPEPQPPLPEPVPEPQPEPLPEPSDQLETVEADDVVLELLPEPDPVEYETEVYDVEAGFAEEQVPPPPVNPFSTQTAHEAAAEQEQDQEQEQEQEQDDEYAPETAEHTHAGVAAAMAAVGADPSTQTPQPTQPVPVQPDVPPEETETTFPAVHLGGVANLPTKREGLSVRLSEEGLDIMQGPRDIIGRLVWDEIEALEVPNLRPRRRAKQTRARLIVRTPHGDASFEVPDIPAEDLRERVEPFMRLHGGH